MSAGPFGCCSAPTYVMIRNGDDVERIQDDFKKREYITRFNKLNVETMMLHEALSLEFRAVRLPKLDFLLARFRPYFSALHR